MSRCALLLLAVLAAHCGAAEHLLLEATPAWDGLTRQGAGSEIGLRLVARHGGELALTLKTPAARLAHTATLEPDSPLALTLPVPPGVMDRVFIEARLDGQPGTPEDIHLKQLPADQPVVAVIGEISGAWQTNRRLSVFYPGPAALPRHEWSYAVIDLLVMDTPSLRQLSAEQTVTLKHYLAGCGRFIAWRIPQPAVGVLRSHAGCNGQRVMTADNLQQLEHRAGVLLADYRPSLPSVVELRSLLPEEDRQHWLMPTGVFFTGYLLVLLAAAQGGRCRACLPAIPVAASLLGLYAWSGGAIETRQVHWAVMEEGSTTARYTLLLQARALGQGEASIALPARTGFPVTPAPDMIMQVRQRPDAAGQLLDFSTRLFSRHEFVLQGSIRPDMPLEVSVSPGGPVIHNSGNTLSPSSLLTWRGNKYTVPALSPGARWTAPAEAEPWGNDGAERLLREQAVREQTALLIPYSPVDAGIIMADTASSGYLMVYL